MALCFRHAMSYQRRRTGLGAEHAQEKDQKESGTLLKQPSNVDGHVLTESQVLHLLWFALHLAQKVEEVSFSR